MREILFKGKRDDNGEWVYGSFIPDLLEVYQGYKDLDGYIKPYGKTREERLMIAVPRETVCQYTGLNDKNGTKIFEGDVVLVDWFGNNGKFVVGYEGGSFFPYQIGCKFNFNSLWDVWFQDKNGTIMEVIGNIHDNPELLEEN